VAGHFNSIGFGTGDFGCYYIPAAISYERSLFNVPEVRQNVRVVFCRREMLLNKGVSRGDSVVRQDKSKHRHQIKKAVQV